MFTLVLLSHVPERADLNPTWLERLARGLTNQLQRDFCPDYELAAWSVTTDATQPGPVIHLFAHPDQARALGYHAVDPNGNPYGRVFTDDATAQEIETTTSHEACELVGDEDADRFRFPAGATARAEEACDAVEDQSYADPDTGVLLSDYVLPSWYRTGSSAPWNRLGNLPGPLTKTEGGYWIEIDASGRFVTNPPEASARPGKDHAGGRTARRLARNTP